MIWFCLQKQKLVAHSSIFQGLKEDPFERWSWAKGKSPNLGYSNWKFGEPRDIVLNGEQQCGALNSQGKWESLDCTVKLKSICQKHVDPRDYMKGFSFLIF